MYIFSCIYVKRQNKIYCLHIQEMIKIKRFIIKLNGHYKQHIIHYTKDDLFSKVYVYLLENKVGH